VRRLAPCTRGTVDAAMARERAIFTARVRK
jgi:hypothetical protein